VLSGQTKLCEVHELGRTGNDALDDIRRNKDAVEAALAFDFINSEPDAHGTEVLADLALRMSLNPALARAVPFVLQKDPEERSLFERQVVEQLHHALQKRLAQLQSELEVQDPKGAERAAAVDNIERELDVALQRQQEAVVSLKRAEDEQRQASAAALEAKLRIKAFVPEYKSAAAPRDVKQEELRNFEAGALSMFLMLRDFKVLGTEGKAKNAKGKSCR